MEKAQKRAFIPVMIGIFIFAVCTGANTALSSAYILFSEKFNVSVTEVVLGNSVMSITAFFLMQFSGNFINRFGARLSMIVAIVGVAIGFIIMAFAPNVYIVWIGFAFVAAIQAFGQHNAVTTLIRNWVAPKKQNSYMGLVLGVLAAGSAVWPFLGGQFFSRMTLSSAFLALIPCFSVPVLIAVIFLIKEKPEDAGVKPIGWDASDVDEVKNNGGMKTDTDEKYSAYKIPAFWLCALGMLVMVVLYSQLTLLATCLQMSGMDVALAASLVSLINLFALVANYLGGWLREKFGIRFLVVYSFGLIFISSAGLYMFFASGSTIALWIFVITNALSRPFMNIYVYIVSEIFKDKANMVQPKVYSFSFLGGLIITPAISALADQWGGYTNVCWVWVAAALGSIAIWLIALKRGKSAA